MGTLISICSGGHAEFKIVKNPTSYRGGHTQQRAADDAQQMGPHKPLRAIDRTVK